MKKLFITATVIGSVLSSLAMAKTEGNYVGVDVISTQVGLTDLSDKFFRYSETSAGVNYKYAFNFNNFFVAPGLFYNHNGVKAVSAENTDSLVQELKYSYGVKLDLGYDINDKVAAFVTVGHSENRLHFSYNTSGVVNEAENATEEAFLYGIGAKYSVTDHLDLNVGYEISQYGMSNNLTNTTDKFSPDYKVAKFGASYKF